MSIKIAHTVPYYDSKLAAIPRHSEPESNSKIIANQTYNTLESLRESEHLIR